MYIFNFILLAYCLLWGERWVSNFEMINFVKLREKYVKINEAAENWTRHLGVQSGNNFLLYKQEKNTKLFI